jgi:glycosyltransferase involved in cell wall biosynthesis
VIRILHALSGGHIGGTERMVDRIVRGLNPSAFHSEISVLDEAGATSTRLAESGFPVHHLDGRRGRVGAIRRFAAVLHAGRYDIVHLYGFRVSLLGRLAARLCRARPKVIHGIRGLHVTEGLRTDAPRTQAALKLERLLTGLIDLYVTNSVGAVDFLVSAGLPAAKFHVIPNGIEPDIWRPSPDRSRHAVPVVVAVANFRPIKRLADLIDALALVQHSAVPFRAVIIGDGPLRGELQARIDRHGLGALVMLPGQLTPDQVRRELDNADVFVLPSLWEGMPVSVMEAMSMAVPVVGTDVPGIRELVVSDETGLLVPSCAPDSLATALTRLLRDRGAASSMGAAGRVRIVRCFSLDRMVAAHAAVYGRLVNG